VALTWDTTNVADNESVCFMEAPEDLPNYGLVKGDRMLNPVTNALIWHSLNTGIGTITRENASEVFARIKLVETIYGASLRKGGEDRPITSLDVLQHVGLKTNASFKIETRASFLKRHAARFLDDEAHRGEKQFAEYEAKPATASA